MFEKIKHLEFIAAQQQRSYAELPLVYACSGCSSAAQMANALAVRLDREHLAEMSCIAGIGGDVQPLVRAAQRGRKILALDGCLLHCVRNCLKRYDIEPSYHLELADHGIKKRHHTDATEEEIKRVWDEAVIPALIEIDNL
ncbi:hypothetical protein BTA51_16450 [Hahella sp. CCB-MM4]|uniref:putative zinc-binding protein n=1 Tax=Hahella sp. (strain CCB-MM4) TaxID=1926491 RepID=UPI000B9AABF9|nr:putative zinc-binding protein [Hahella sp. CCB-MM4]OZG72324.1 hypothetical protein BTA51_16450 [Hahella sp. CCB-MM4]